MKKIILIMLVMLVSGLMYSQSDTTVRLDKTQPLKSGKYQYLMNAQKVPLKTDTAGVGMLTAEAVYVIGGTVKATLPSSINVVEYVDTVSNKDTLSSGTTYKLYGFGSQYEKIKLVCKSDTVMAGADTLKIYNIGYRGDTTDVWILDSANSRVSCIVTRGDKKFREYRLDIYCAERLLFKFSDAVIWTTKWYIIPKGYRK